MTIESSSEGSEGLPPTQPANISQSQLLRSLRLRLERHVDDAGIAPALTIVGFGSDDCDVLRQGIGHPEEAVLGFVLPRRYGAIGIIASSIVSAPPRNKHHDEALALGVTRTGETVSLLTSERGIITTHAAQGWLVDAARRAVHLSTSPCDIHALSFPVALWLDRLMVAILNAPSSHPVRWADAVDLCPIPGRWRSTDPIDLGATLGSTSRSWPSMRRATVAGTIAPLGMKAAWASWMDDAMYARWCMGYFPNLASLRADVEFLAPADVAEGIELTLRSAQRSFLT